MKKLIIALALLTIAGGVIAADRVEGYTRQNGTYVQPYERTAPNNTRTDNYSSQGNTNPYTGQQGTRDPYAQPNPYAQPQRRQNGY